MLCTTKDLQPTRMRHIKISWTTGTSVTGGSPCAIRREEEPRCRAREGLGNLSMAKAKHRYWMQNYVNLKAREELHAVQEAPALQACLIMLPYISPGAGLLWACLQLPPVCQAPQHLASSVSHTVIEREELLCFIPWETWIQQSSQAISTHNSRLSSSKEKEKCSKVANIFLPFSSTPFV